MAIHARVITVLPTWFGRTHCVPDCGTRRRTCHLRGPEDRIGSEGKSPNLGCARPWSETPITAKCWQAKMRKPDQATRARPSARGPRALLRPEACQRDSSTSAPLQDSLAENKPFPENR